MPRRLAPAFAALALLAPSPARAALSWVIMPVHAAHPPPQDPTLLRLSVPLARAFEAKVEGEVRLAAREERDERCRDEGWRCPREIAELLGVDRVVFLRLDDAQESLQVSVYAGRQGVVARTELECAWEGGRLTCDAEAMGIFAAGLGPRTLDPKEVDVAFEALAPALARCAQKGRTQPDAKVVFQVGPKGGAQHVRVEPRGLQRKKAYACMARAVEGLQVAPFHGAPAGPFERPLPTRGE
jgi:hypothetical protein